MPPSPADIEMVTAGGDQLIMEDNNPLPRLPTALVNVRVSCHSVTQAAMPNVREKDVSISARNHEPASFEQHADTHDRKPLPDSPPPPNSELLAAMEFVASEGLHMETKLETLVAKLGEAAAVIFLVGKEATVKWSTSPLASALPLPPPIPKAPNPKCWNCGDHGHYAVGCPRPSLNKPSAPMSVSPPEVVSGRDQAVADSLAKWGSVIPKARPAAMVTGQLTTKEWQAYRCTPASIWKFRNKTPASGISCVFNGKT